MYCSYYSNIRGVTSLPPERNLVPRFTKEERFIRKQKTVMGPLLWSQRHKGRHDHFFNSRVGIVPTISEILQTETSFNVGLT
jgi:hypothetical protein